MLFGFARVFTGSMPQRNLVVIGASAGGIAALQQLLHALPAEFPGAILVVVHISRESPGLLPEILNRAGPLPAANARAGEIIRNGHIYVAPPDVHLLVGPNRRIQIGHGPKENRFRPAVDPLFRSAAVSYGPQVIGIVLSGGLDDGTAGLCAIKQAGGVAVVQDPEEAEATSMPQSALRHVAADCCLTAREIGEFLPQLLQEVPAAKPPMSDYNRLEAKLAADERNHPDVTRLGDASIYTCPSCAGTLVRVRNAVPVRFRCHTGHAFTALSLEDELRGKVEDVAWSAIRSLQEHAMLLQELVQQPGFRNDEIAEYNDRAEAALKRVQMLREALALKEDAGK